MSVSVLRVVLLERYFGFCAAVGLGSERFFRRFYVAGRHVVSYCTGIML